MRSRCCLVVFALIAGCGDPSTPVRGPSSDIAPGMPVRRAEGAATVASRDLPENRSRSPALLLAREPRRAGPAAPGSPEALPIGHLERRDRLERLFESLARLEAGTPSADDVRIAQFGDSHTASDLGTAVVRRVLQARFGDGGRGFVSIGKPWKTYVQDGIHGGMSDGFEPVRVRFQKGQFEGVDGCYGLLGVGIGTSKAGERAWTDIGVRTSRIELDYWQEPAGGSFDVFVDGQAFGRVATRSSVATSGFRDVDLADAVHQLELRAVGDGSVRIFGMTLDRAQAGVVVDALGINGAESFTPLRWSEEHFAEQLRHRAPDLVVLAYGTNESVETKLSDADYERSVVDLLGRVARAMPTASCLLLGPTDRAVRASAAEGWVSAPRIAEIAQIQGRVARAAGCAFYDQLAAMGGPGSMVVWAAEADPRAARDRVHLTRSGYAQLGTSLADDLVHGYDEWRAERGLPATGARRTWGMASSR